MLNYLVNPAMTPSSEFAESAAMNAMYAVPAYGEDDYGALSTREARARFKLRGKDVIAQMKNYTVEKLRHLATNPNRGPKVQAAAKAELASRGVRMGYDYGADDFYDPTEPGEAYGEDEDDADLLGDDDGDDDFGDDEDDDFGDDEDDDFGDDEDDDDFGDDEDDDDFGLLEKAIQAAVSKSVGPTRMRYAKLAREITNLIDKGKRGEPATFRKIGKLRALWAKLGGMKNGTSGLESPAEVLREAGPSARPAARPAPAPVIRKVAPKIMPTLPPIRTVAPVSIPATNADRVVAERATSAAEARSRFLLRGPEIIAQMKNYTIEKLVSIASNPNRGPEVRKAASDEIARRRATRGGGRRPVVVVQAPGAPAPAPVVTATAPLTAGRSRTVTFGAIPRIVAADNVFDSLSAFKAEAALLGLGVFFLGAYAGPPLLKRLSR